MVKVWSKDESYDYIGIYFFYIYYTYIHLSVKIIGDLSYKIVTKKMLGVLVD